MALGVEHGVTAVADRVLLARPQIVVAVGTAPPAAFGSADEAPLELDPQGRSSIEGRRQRLEGSGEDAQLLSPQAAPDDAASFEQAASRAIGNAAIVIGVSRPDLRPGFALLHIKGNGYIAGGAAGDAEQRWAVR